MVIVMTSFEGRGATDMYAPPTRERERERAGQKLKRKAFVLFLIDWEEGGFGILILCHLNKTHIQVML